ncbi:hypothetical protein HDU67_005197 [Dinochytrium kinnereticum]|nr:hypothetical protein HDU67_005197 [Dinochytrium kinnereticum]
MQIKSNILNRFAKGPCKRLAHRTIPIDPLCMTSKRSIGMLGRNDPFYDFFSNFDRLVSNRLASALRDFDQGTRAIAGPSNQGGKDLTPSASSTPMLSSIYSPLADFWGVSPRTGHFSLDVTETDNNYVVRADVPGISKDDLSISLKDDILTISGEKKSESESTDDKKHIVERCYGAFNRSVRLPADADESSISAKLNNGVLELTVTKKPVPPEEAPKKIAIE